MTLNVSRIVVTGANGFVGYALCRVAVARGMHVQGVTRHPSELPANVDRLAVGDISEGTDWQRILVNCDVVIHLAARVHVMKEAALDPLSEFRRVNTLATEHFARSAVKAGVKRFVFVSSIGVNGLDTCGGAIFSELDLPRPHNSYAESKFEAEQALHCVAKKTGLEVVVVRPPLVYGAGVKGNFLQMLSVLSRGVPLPLASICNQRSLIYVENLVDALMLCATHPAAAGQTYLVSDGEDISTPDLLTKLSLAMEMSPRLIPFPVGLLRLVGRLVGKADQVARLVGSLQIDSTKIRRELGWVPPFSLDDGLKATVRDEFL